MRDSVVNSNAPRRLRLRPRNIALSARALRKDQVVLTNYLTIFGGSSQMKSIAQALMLAVEMGMFFAVLVVLHHAGLIAF